jgi:hypothetical protein
VRRIRGRVSEGEGSLRLGLWSKGAEGREGVLLLGVGDH